MTCSFSTYTQASGATAGVILGNVENAVYKTNLTLGSLPALNKISAIGEYDEKVPEIDGSTGVVSRNLKTLRDATTW